jgi:hypothetical protein
MRSGKHKKGAGFWCFFKGGCMAIDLSSVGDAKVAVAVAGALVVSVWVAIKAIHWIQLVLIVRQASREEEEWENRRA